MGRIIQARIDGYDEKKITTYLNENRKRWIDKDTCDLLYSKDRNNFYKVNQQEIDSYESHRGEYDDVWYNYSYFFNCPELSFNNLYLKFCNNDFYLIAYVWFFDRKEDISFFHQRLPKQNNVRHREPQTPFRRSHNNISPDSNVSRNQSKNP